MKKLWKLFVNSHLWRIHHEELIIIPSTLIGFYFIGQLLGWLFPDTPLFDFWSQIEIIVYKSTLFFVALGLAWIALRVFFPPIYRFMSNEFYNNFENQPIDVKMKYGVAFLLTFILSVCLISAKASTNNNEIRDSLVKVLNLQLYVRETQGPNRGPEVDMYNREVKAPMGSSWCGAFVGWNLTQFHIINPNSAWSPNYALPKDIIWKYKKLNSIKPLPGDVPTYWNAHLGRVGHVGIYTYTDLNGYFITIEGNTNNNGSFNGDGVYKKKRNPNQVYAISRYIKP